MARLLVEGFWFGSPSLCGVERPLHDDAVAVELQRRRGGLRDSLRDNEGQLGIAGLVARRRCLLADAHPRFAGRDVS